MAKKTCPIIVALDVATQNAALELVEQLRDQISFFKVGLQLYTAAGPEIVREIIHQDANVFLDLKLHDIPNTVAGAVGSACELGVQMLTLHLSGGRAMLEAAVATKSSDLLLLGVTVLTSADDKTLDEIGVVSPVAEHVRKLAELGAAAGIDGVIASPHEIQKLREHFGESLTIVTPGIRPSWSQANDQKRVMTPREALTNGADYIVIGRPITADKDPREATRRILEEIGN